MADLPPTPRVLFAEAVARYERALVDELRGFSAGGAVAPFLERWVHDEVVPRSLRALAEAAAEDGLAAVQVGLSAEEARTLDGRDAEVSLGEGAISRQWNDTQTVMWVTLEHARFPAIGPAAPDGRPAHPQARARVAAAPVHAGHDFLPPAHTETLAAADFDAHVGEPLSTDLVLDAPWGITSWKVHLREARAVAFEVLTTEPEAPAARLLAFASRVLIGRPLQELRDHGVARVELALRGRRAPAGVTGIFLPQSHARAFAELQRLLDGFTTALMGAEGFKAANTWTDQPQPAWRALGADEQTRRANAVAMRVLTELRIPAAPEDTPFVRRVDQDFLVACEFPDVGGPGARGHILMELERALRDELDPCLVVVTEERRDQHKGRRLKLAAETTP